MRVASVSRNRQSQWLGKGHRFIEPERGPLRAEAGASLAGAMKYTFYAPLILFCLSLLLTPSPVPASPIEHPGILHQNDNCSSCHGDKMNGKSVHSAMTIPCTVCHLAETQGDMTTLRPMMPKEQICFACHERSSELKQHSPVKGLCMDCHDAHSSKRRMLLRKRTAAGPD